MEFMANQPFVYAPLSKQPDSFRYIILHPDEVDSAPSCDIVHSSVASSSYEALSYVWGDTDVMRPILLSGKSFNITTNLHLALSRLRYQDRPRILWVDAICINQSDVAERSKQVGLMAQIYQQCSRVVIWLCEATVPTTIGVEWLNIVCDYLEKRGYPYARIAYLANSADSQELLHVSADLLTLEYRTRWFSVLCLLRTPWWNRVWTVQEAVLAPEAIFVIGKTATKWERFYTVTALLSNLGEAKGEALGISSLLYCIPTVTGLLAARQDRLRGSLRNSPVATAAQSIGSDHLLFWLALQRTRQCKDPRDKVFSILGLVHTKIGQAIRPDYAQTADQIYILAVKKYIELYGNLNILWYSNPTPFQTCPSWCPDWFGPHEKGIIGDSRHTIEYTASAECNPTVHFSEDSRLMWLRGVEVDQVERVSVQDTNQRLSWETPGLGFRCNWDLHAVAESLAPQLASDQISSCFRSPKGNRALEILLDTLVLGRLEPNGFGAGEALRVQVLINDPSTDEEWPPDRIGYSENTIHACCRSLVLTRKGRLVLASVDTQPDDRIFILRGSAVPIILRSQDNAYCWVTNAYICGFEAVADHDKGSYEEKIITLR